MVKKLNCGVKFCGGCNPRYDRSFAFEKLKQRFGGSIDFDYAAEKVPYDFLLLVCGCTNCCASYEQYDTKKNIIKLWDEAYTESIFSEIEKIIEAEEY